MCDVCQGAPRCPCCAEESNESELVGFEFIEGREVLVDTEDLRDHILCGPDSPTNEAFEDFLWKEGGEYDDLEKSNALLHDFADWVNCE